MQTKTELDTERGMAETRQPPHDILRWIYRRRRWAACVSLGLLLEVATTLWTLKQAMSLGVFQKADCGVSAIASYLNRLLPRHCENVEFSEVFWNDTLYEYRTLPDYVGCDGLENPTRTEQMRLCDCPMSFGRLSKSGCAWTAATSTLEGLGGLCLAMPVLDLSDTYKYWMRIEPNTTQDLLLDRSVFEVGGSCKAVHPPGSGKVTIGFLAVGLGVELVEGLVSYVYLSHPRAGTGMMAAGAGFEAAGMVVIHSWMVLSQAYWYSWLDSYVSLDQQLFLMNMHMVAVASASLGAMIEVLFFCSGTAANLLPYLGALGNALIWLGAGLTEVGVTLYLTWRLEPSDFFSRDDDMWSDIGYEVIGLIVFEVLGLIAMCAARVLLTKARRALTRAMVQQEIPWVEVVRLLGAEPVQSTSQPPNNRMVVCLSLCFFVFTYVVFTVEMDGLGNFFNAISREGPVAPVMAEVIVVNGTQYHKVDSSGFG